MKAILFLTSLMTLPFAPCSSQEPTKVLDFQSAYQRILDHSLLLKSVELEICVKQAQQQQVGTRPNPEFSFHTDYLGQTKQNESCGLEEFTFTLTQLLELGGKRRARIRVASSEECLADWDHEIAKLDLHNQLLHAFIDTALAQHLLDLTEDQKKDADETFSCICAKNANGKVSLIEEKKAQIICNTLKLTWLRTQTQFEVAKKSLAAFWGSPCPDFDSVSFPLYYFEAPPPLEELEACLLNNPELLKSKAVIARASEIVHLERSHRIPDLVVNAGVTAYVANCPTTFSLGFDIPIPVFNQNQGNISRANYELMQAEYGSLDIEQNLKSKLKAFYESWQTAFIEAKTLRDEIIPAAVDTFNIARESYREGKFDYLEMLDSRKILFDANQQYLNAVTNYQHIKADVERLIASPIEMCENL